MLSKLLAITREKLNVESRPSGSMGSLEFLDTAHL